MSSQRYDSNVHHRIAEGTCNVALELFGPTVEFLTSPDDAHDDFCVMRGVVPPGAVIPLHSHDDTETFFIVAGAQQVLVQGAQGPEWSDAHAGDYVHVKGGTPHAHRNVSHGPAIDLIVTTARLGKFFQEAGRLITGSPQPPTPEEVARFAAIAAKYGYWLGTLEENAAVGIEMPKFAGDE
jgi:quercetin dioxygenase-like cupin family protein